MQNLIFQGLVTRASVQYMVFYTAKQSVGLFGNTHFCAVYGFLYCEGVCWFVKRER